MPGREADRQLTGNRVARAVARFVGVVLLLLGGFFVFWGTCLAAAWGIHPDVTTGSRIFIGVAIGLLGLFVGAGGWALVRASRMP
jgi:hypothetical protein